MKLVQMVDGGIVRGDPAPVGEDANGRAEGGGLMQPAGVREGSAPDDTCGHIMVMWLHFSPRC